MLTLQVQNTYIKTISKPKNTFKKPCFETVYSGENAKPKSCQKMPQLLRFLHLFKKSQLAFKSCPIWQKITHLGQYLLTFYKITPLL